MAKTLWQDPDPIEPTEGSILANAEAWQHLLSELDGKIAEYTASGGDECDNDAFLRGWKVIRQHLANKANHNHHYPTTQTVPTPYPEYNNQPIDHLQGSRAFPPPGDSSVAHIGVTSPSYM